MRTILHKEKFIRNKKIRLSGRFVSRLVADPDAGDGAGNVAHHFGRERVLEEKEDDAQFGPAFFKSVQRFKNFVASRAIGVFDDGFYKRMVAAGLYFKFAAAHGHPPQ